MKNNLQSNDLNLLKENSNRSRSAEAYESIEKVLFSDQKGIDI